VYFFLSLDRVHRTFRGWSGQFVLPGTPFAASLGSFATSGSKIMMSRDYALRFQQLWRTVSRVLTLKTEWLVYLWDDRKF
jgi:hypothetical protein